MPTLLQINTVYNTGSTGRIAADLDHLARDRGWRSYVAYGRGGGGGDPDAIRIGTERDVHWHGAMTRLFDRHGLASARATRRLIRQIGEIAPDILHLHNLHGYYLHYPLLFRYLAEADIPVVWTLHDCWLFTGHCVYFDAAGCEKWKTACSRCPQTASYPASLFLDRSEKNFSRKRASFTAVKKMMLVPVSRWMEGLAAGSFLREFPRQVIYNGIDTGAFRPADPAEVKKKFGLEGRTIVLGVSAGWSPRKGLKDLLELSARLGEEFRLVVVGLTENQWNSLPAGVTGIRHTENLKELAALYSAADVLVNPTYEDNFPTTNLEALACGTPVITYRTGGSPEAVSEETGCVVEKGDVPGLAEAVIRVRRSGKEHYAPRCRERAVALYDRRDRYAEYLELYESLRK